jgi:hypothetical protein
MVEFPHNSIPAFQASCQNLLTLQTNKHLDATHCYRHEETVDSSFSIISDQIDVTMLCPMVSPKKVDGSTELEMS